METTILMAIRKELSEFSAQQKLVANFILADPEESAFMTSSQLADASGTSDATVIRFANRLGCKKYADLQAELRKLVRDRLTQVERLKRSSEPEQQSSLMQTAIHSMHTDIKSIEQTLANLDEEELAASVQAIAEARRVYVAGTHSEYGIACYFASTLSWIKEQVYLMDESHTPTFDAMSDVSTEDVMVALSFPPYPAATVRFTDAALRRGAKIIAVTDSPLSPLAQRADYCLLVHDVKLFFADNSGPTMSLLSVILALVSSHDYEKSTASLKKMSDYWEEMDFYYRDKD